MYACVPCACLILMEARGGRMLDTLEIRLQSAVSSFWGSSARAAGACDLWNHDSSLKV